MGCFPVSNQGQVHSVQEVKILPSSFVAKNSHKFSEIYHVRRRIGLTRYNEVRLAIHKQTKVTRAVKIIKKGRTDNAILQEIEFLKTLDHPHLVRIYEYFEDAKRCYIVMEYCKGGELFDEILKRQKFTERSAVVIMQQLLSVVKYLHEHSIIHRDIRPENILLEEKASGLSIKLIDFGNATTVKRKTDFKMTHAMSHYIAPEVFKHHYNEKCDLWSCGVILYILLSGVAPFVGHSVNEIVRQIKSGSFYFQVCSNIKASPEAQNMIISLVSDADTRLSATNALNHPWIRKYSKKAEDDAVCFVLNKLKSFQIDGKLRDAINTYIATQCLNNDMTRELTEAFEMMDTNKDGKLSREELLSQYQMFMGTTVEEEVNRIIDNVDSDFNGYIDYSEFIRATMDTDKAISTENLKFAFDMFDKDESGTISAVELKRVLDDGLPHKSDFWRDIIKEVDLNGDGEIDFYELESLIVKSYK